MIIHDCFCKNASAFWWTDACILLIPELFSFRLQSIEEDTALICLSLSFAIFACIISSFSLEIVSMF